MGDDLTALLAHLDLGPVHLAGISDGGVVALDQALRRPQTVRTIAVVGTNYCVDDQTLGAVRGIDADAIERDLPALAATFADRHDAGKHPGFWKELLQQIIDNNAINPTWTPEDLRRIACPTLVMAGERDPFANIDQMTTMRREIPRAEWLIVNASGHVVHFEHPEIVGPRIIDFWDRHARRNRAARRHHEPPAASAVRRRGLATVSPSP